MTRLDDLHTWQRWFADQGLMSFPLYGLLNGECRCIKGADCKQPGKHPRIKGWRRLEEPYPVTATDNLGVSTDKLVVVDIDTGDEIPDDLPETFTVSTGRGLHLWYWGNPNHPIRNAAGWRPGIDLRAVGGLVAAPGSQHASGAVYQYIGGGVVPVPDVVLSTRARHEERKRKPQVTEIMNETILMIEPTIDALVESIEEARNGERNHVLFRSLCRFFELAELGYAGADSLQRLFEAALSIGLDRAEVVATIDSASRSLTE